MSTSKNTICSSLARRKLITKTGVACGAMLTASSLPKSWIKPVTNSIMLPAHAQTSEGCDTSCLSPATYCSSNDSTAIRLTVSEDGTLQVETPDGMASAQVDICEGGNFSVTIGANTLSGTIPCGETESIEVTQSNGSGTAVFNLTKELCSATPVSCLLPATYCEGRGMGSIRVTVTAEGNVTVEHPNGTATAMIDTATGGSYSVTVMSMGGNTITLSGSIPCGDVDSVELVEDNGTGPTTLTLSKDLCRI